MMIQNSNPLSMLSGLVSGGAVQPGLLAEGGNAADFTASLMQQLALLQGNLTKNATVDVDVLADLQAKAGAIDGRFAGQEVQEFAALFGNALPTAKKIDQDINLDDTLSALSDVLKYLQDLGTDGAEPVLAQSAMDGSVQTVDVQDHPADTPVQPSEQEIDLAALAAAASAAMPQIQPQPLPQSPQVLEQEGMQAPVAEAISSEMPNATVVGDNALLALKKATPPGHALSSHEVFAPTPGENDKQPLALDGQSANAMLSRDNASGNAGQEKPATPNNSKDDLALVANQAKSIEFDKNPAKVATDIAQLNQAVSADKPVEVPAMTRHLGHPEWNKELGEKLIWMHKQAIPSAELRLNPEHLGPISIKVDVNQDQTTVAFTAHNPGVKEAIESALPKLREMLSGQQLNLVDVNVSQHQSEQRQPNDFFKMASEQWRHGGNGQNDDAENPAIQAATDIVDEIEAGRAIASNGVLSLFA